MEKIAKGATGILREEIDALEKRVLARVPEFTAEDANQIEFAMEEPSLLDPRDAELALAFLATGSLAKACEAAGYTSLVLAEAMLMSDPVAKFIAHQKKKRIIRLMFDGDQFVLNYLKLAKEAADNEDWKTAKECYKEAERLCLPDHPSWSTPANQTANVNNTSLTIQFGRQEELEGSEESDREATPSAGRIDVSGGVRQGVLRSTRAPVHADT